MTSRDHCQYGEESIILDYFNRQRGLFVVDCGAADGIEFSNSRFLIRDHGWSGILIEPEPDQFHALQYLYANTPSVRTIHAAVGEQERMADLQPCALASTFVDSWRERAIQRDPANVFGKPVQVRMAPLRTLLHEANCPPTIDFLTIDCEGMDLEVLRSLDSAFNVRLICVESGSDGSGDDPLNVYLRGLGFAYHAHTNGNTFWRKPC